MYNDLLEYSWLIRKIAKKFYNVNKEDLYQAGFLGLLKAQKNYDGVSNFGTFAYKYVFGEMYNLVLKSNSIQINKYYLKLYKLILLTKNKLMQDYKREVSNLEISKYLNISIDEIDYISNVMMMPVSLDTTDIDIGYNEELDNKILLQDSLNNLDTLSHQVMYYRFMMDLTQSEVANILGISQVKVSRIESKSKEKILEFIS